MLHHFLRAARACHMRVGLVLHNSGNFDLARLAAPGGDDTTKGLLAPANEFAGGVAFMLADSNDKDCSKNPFDLFMGLYASGGYHGCIGTLTKKRGLLKAAGVPVRRYHRVPVAPETTPAPPPSEPAPPPSTRCTNDPKEYFPQTDKAACGAIYSFWRDNGTLPVFGYPITEQRLEHVESQPYLVQWFEIRASRSLANP